MKSARLIGPVMGANPPSGAPQRDLDELGYVCEEFILDGTTVAYRHRGEDRPTSDGRWDAEENGEAPYRTRILVVRPSDPSRFNGTVLLNWQNVSAGLEIGSPTEDEIYRGYAWVGVSAQEFGLYGSAMGGVVRGRSAGKGLTEADPERYESLFHPGDMGSFEIYGQAALAVGPQRDNTDVDPLGGLEVRRVIAMGGSQSAMRLVAYANGIHALHHVVDGFLITVWEGRAPRLEEGPMPAGMATALRDDLDVPALIVNSEFEAGNGAALQMPDSDRLRVWEVAGTAHGVLHRGIQSDRQWGPNPVSWQPVQHAAIRRMHEWLADGVAPASLPRIAVESSTLVRDALGNVVGGVRLPELAAPTAEYRGQSFKTGFGVLFGGYRPFPDETITELYPSRQAYVQQWDTAVDELLSTGALLPEDADAIRARGRDVADTLPLPTAS